MEDTLRRPLTDLKAGSMLRVRNGRGRAIVVFDGQVWITQSDDWRDFVLDGGESFDVDHQGLTLVEAVRDSKLLLVDAEADQAERPSSYTLYLQAREQRGKAIAAALRRGALALHRAVATVAARLVPTWPAPPHPAICTAAR